MCMDGLKYQNITLNRTLKFSLKGPVRTHHYLNTYIRFNMIDINEQLKAINVYLSIIDTKTQLINDKLDEVIAALHEYDDDELHCGYSGLPSVKMYDDEATTNTNALNIVANTNALNIVGVKYQKQYNLNRDKMANDHYELGGEG